jgi:nickel-type superoxide dismutase maturation protease
MIPNLKPGDEVLVNPRAYRQQAPQIGDLVLARRPDREVVTMIKRVSAVYQDGRLLLLGDNPAASTDSRTFGPVSRHYIVGKVTSRFG